MRKNASLVMLGVTVVLTVLSVVLAATMEATSTPRPGAIQVPLKSIEALRIYHGLELFAEVRNRKGDWRLDVPPLALKDDVPDARVLEELLAFVRRCLGNPLEVTPEEAGIDLRDPGIQFEVKAEESNPSFFVGDYSEDGKWRYVVFDTDPRTVHGIHAELTSVFDRKAEEFRSLDLFELGSFGAERIELLSAGGDKSDHVVMERTDAGWVIVRPVRWPAEPQAVDRLLRLCAGLRAKRIQSHGGLVAEDAPAIRIRAGQEEQAVRFGRVRENDAVVAVRVGRNALYIVDDTLYRELVPLQLDRYRRRVLSLLPREPAALEIDRHGERLRLVRVGGIWHAEGARTFEVEPEAVDRLIATLRQVGIQQFVSESSDQMTRYGLHSPRLEVAAVDAGGQAFARIRLGQPVEGGPLYATLEGRPQIFVPHPATGVELAQPFIAYRTRRIADIDFRTVKIIRIVGAGFRREYKHNTGVHYQMVEPETRPLAEKPNFDFLKLVQKLSALRCERYLVEKPENLSKFGLDHPQMRVILMTKSAHEAGKKVVLDLVIGNSVEVPVPGEGRVRLYCARKRGEGPVFLLSETLVRMLECDYR